MIGDQSYIEDGADYMQQREIHFGVPECLTKPQEGGGIDGPLYGVGKELGQTIC